MWQESLRVLNATGWFWGGEGPGGGRGNKWNRAPREVGDELEQPWRMLTGARFHQVLCPEKGKPFHYNVNGQIELRVFSLRINTRG